MAIPSAPSLRTLLWIQSSYYLVTGIWPLVSIESFQAITGKKYDHLVTGKEGDHWLVMTVGVLITAIAITLCVGAWRQSESVELGVLAVASAIGLTVIDIVYVIRGAILPIYLVDAVAEMVLLAGWSMVCRRRIIGIRQQK